MSVSWAEVKAAPDRSPRDRIDRLLFAQQVRAATAIERQGPVQTLPVPPALEPLLPDGGLRRGTTVAAAGSTALALALIAATSAAGSWCAVVGCPWLGVAAAAEAGVELSRLALVPDPGRQWAETVAALLDGVDVVVGCPPAQLSAPEMRRLSLRARERGAVIIPLETATGRSAWMGADIRLTAVEGRWEGIDSGAGRLRARRVVVESGGRGAAARPRRAEFWLPSWDAVPAILDLSTPQRTPHTTRHTTDDVVVPAEIDSLPRLQPAS